MNDDNYERPAPRLLPGQEICDCGTVREIEDRHKCAHCGAVGCIACMVVCDDTGEEFSDTTWVCGPDCAIGWLEELQASEEKTHRSYQDFLGARIESWQRRKGVAA
jgi:hypothetical protein